MIKRLHLFLFFSILFFVLPGQAQNTEEGDTITISLPDAYQGLIQWQFSDDLLFWRNLKDQTGRELTCPLKETGFFRAKIRTKTDVLFSDTSFFYAAGDNYAGPTIIDSKTALKINWDYAITPHLIDHFNITIEENDTLIQTHNRDNTVVLSRKMEYYHKTISIEAVTNGNFVLPKQTVVYENNMSVYFNQSPYFAHRGLSEQYPENTRRAFEEAAKAGFRYVECDVWLTQDDVWVVLHDENIERTSDGKGDIGTFFSDDLKKFNFGYPKKFGDKYPQQLLSLPEFLQLCKDNGVRPLIEIKEEKFRYLNMVNLLNIIHNYFSHNEYAIQSFNKRALNQIRRIDDEVVLGFLTDDYSPKDRTTLRNLYPCFYNLGTNKNLNNKPLSDKANSSIYSLYQAGIFIGVWTVDDPKLIGHYSNNNMFILTNTVPGQLNPGDR